MTASPLAGGFKIQNSRFQIPDSKANERLRSGVP
jgi:hypothetical protein